MRISALAQASGYPVPTLKFYLRSGLLPPGERTGATTADYGQQHLDRLRLIRALTETGGLRLAQVGEVLAALRDEHPVAAIGAAYLALAGDPGEEKPDGRAHRVLAELGWSTPPDDPVLRHLEQAIATLDEVGMPIDDDSLRTYAAAAMEVAGVDVARIAFADRERAVTGMVLGTILYEPVLLGLRRLAHAHLTTERLGEPS